MSNNYFVNTDNYPRPRSTVTSQELFDVVNRIVRGFDQLPPPIGGGVQGFLGGQFNQVSISSPNIQSGSVGSFGLPIQTLVANSFFVDSIDGTPVDTPSVGIGNNLVEVRYDRTANKLWVYNGSWRSVTLT